MLDQLLVPHDTQYVTLTSSEDAWGVIRRMQVRGAPLIAMVAALGLSVEACSPAASPKISSSAAEAASFLLDKMTYLRTSRPTAVNLFTATDDLAKVVRAAAAESAATGASVVQKYADAAEAMLAADVKANRAIGRFGAEAILAKHDASSPVSVLTICNTGSLATAGYGTALGVVRALYESGRLRRVFACETRPYNQGSRLTAYEIVADGLPGTLICDSMVSACLRDRAKRGEPVAAIVVGADRVAANGDTANKIGTYQLAIAAKHHGADFYIAAPSTSCDLDIACGDDIEIEERPAQEMRSTAGVKVAPDAIDCWNPAFDYAPASLITGIITEFGVIYPTQTESDSPAGRKFDVAGFLRQNGVYCDTPASTTKVSGGAKSENEGHLDKKTKTGNE